MLLTRQNYTYSIIIIIKYSSVVSSMMQPTVQCQAILLQGSANDFSCVYVVLFIFLTLPPSFLVHLLSFPVLTSFFRHCYSLLDRRLLFSTRSSSQFVHLLSSFFLSPPDLFTRFFCCLPICSLAFLVFSVASLLVQGIRQVCLFVVSCCCLLLFLSDVTPLLLIIAEER